MPKSTLVLTFWAEYGLINGHRIQIGEDRDILKVLFQFKFRCRCYRFIDRSLELTSGTNEILTIRPKK